MNITLTCIFLILAANCNPAECLKCYFCVGPEVSPESDITDFQSPLAVYLPEEASVLVRYQCKMKGDEFDPDSNVVDVKEGHKCVQGLTEYNGTKYQVRYKSSNDGCDLELYMILRMVYRIRLKDVPCYFCETDKCNSAYLAISAGPGDSAKSASPDDSGNLLNSFQ